MQNTVKPNTTAYSVMCFQTVLWICHDVSHVLVVAPLHTLPPTHCTRLRNALHPVSDPFCIYRQPYIASTVEREVWRDPAVYNSALSASLKPPLWNERCGEIQLYTTVLCQLYGASTVEREVWGDPAVYNSALSAVRSLHCGTIGVGRSSCMQQCFVSRLKPPLWNERCGEIQLYTTVLCQPSEASTVGRSSCIQQCFVSRLKPPLWNDRCGEIRLYATVLCQPSEASTVEREVWGDPAVCNSALSAVRSLHC